MNRPRQSLLSLFDPLTTQETPARDEKSDKENSTPFSSFFTRQDNHHPSTPVPLPRKRLVDVGDATLDDSSILDLLTEEQEPASASAPCLETPVPPFQRRTPLARLPLKDNEPTPVTRFKPRSSPFILSQATPNDRNTDNPTFNTNEIDTPEILVSCHSQSSQHTIDFDSLSHLSNPLHVDPPFRDDTESSSRLRAPNIASHRLSIDLQASFQLHFQSNSSFDLLNDKMEPMESLLVDDENFDFELERENLRDAMAKFKKEFTPSKHTFADCKSQDDSTQLSEQISGAISSPVPDTDSQRRPCGDTLQSPTSPRDNHQLFQEFSRSPLDGKASKRQSTLSKLPSPTAYRSPVDLLPMPSEEVQSVIPQAKQHRLSTPLVTPRRVPSIALPPAIQALRIVKRTKVHHPKAESADDAHLRATMNVAPHNPSSISSKQGTGQSVHRPSLEKPTSSTKMVSGPRRVTVSETPVDHTASKSNPATSGPKRMTTSSTVPPSKFSSIPTGLKQPTRVESSLPRPSGLMTRMSMSKVPAPGTSRLRKPAGSIPKRVDRFT